MINHALRASSNRADFRIATTSLDGNPALLATGFLS
jgi:hypothetical protein